MLRQYWYKEAIIYCLNVEYFFDHQRIEGLLLEGAIRPVQGKLRPDVSTPGLGLELKRSEAEQYKIYSTTCR